jgi:hypothetical protein
VQIARQNLSEFPAASRFEVIDLTGGAPALEDAFGLSYRSKYDIVLLLAVYHKLRRVMAREDLTALVWHLAARTGKYFAYRSLPEEVEELDAILTDAGLWRVQFSEISMVMENPAAIWTSLPRPIQARIRQHVHRDVYELTPCPRLFCEGWKSFPRRSPRLIASACHCHGQ